MRVYATENPESTFLPKILLISYPILRRSRRDFPLSLSNSMVTSICYNKKKIT